MKYSAVSTLLVISLASFVCVVAQDCEKRLSDLRLQIDDAENKIREFENKLYVCYTNEEVLQQLLQTITRERDYISNYQDNSFLSLDQEETLSSILSLDQEETLSSIAKKLVDIDDENFSRSVLRIKELVDDFVVAQSLQQMVDLLNQLQEETYKAKYALDDWKGSQLQKVSQLVQDKQEIDYKYQAIFDECFGYLYK